MADVGQSLARIGRVDGYLATFGQTDRCWPNVCPSSAKAGKFRPKLVELGPTAPKMVVNATFGGRCLSKHALPRPFQADIGQMLLNGMVTFQAARRTFDLKMHPSTRARRETHMSLATALAHRDAKWALVDWALVSSYTQGSCVRPSPPPRCGGRLLTW